MENKIFIQLLVKSLRPLTSLSAAFLTYLGYKLAGATPNWCAVIEIFFITGMTILTNDYIDRENDAVRKDKDFALNNKDILSSILFFSWMALIFASLFCFGTLGYGNILLGFCIVVGIFYSHTRKILFVPTILVAVTSAVPLLFGYIEGRSDNSLIAFISVACLMFGSEILKDIIDKDTDKGYKKTLLTTGFLFEKEASKLSGSFIFIGYLASLWFAQNLSVTGDILYTTGAVFILLVFFALCFGAAKKEFAMFGLNRYFVLKKIFDFGTYFLLGGLLTL